MVKQNNILKMSAIIGITALFTTFIITIIYSLANYDISKSPAEENTLNSCTNREKTVTVCKEETICQCKGEVYNNKIFFANSEEECPPGCGTISPSSSEGNLGTCNLAALMSSNMPACDNACASKNLSIKSQNITEECCTITLEMPCFPKAQ